MPTIRALSSDAWQLGAEYAMTDMTYVGDNRGSGHGQGGAAVRGVPASPAGYPLTDITGVLQLPDGLDRSPLHTGGGR